jgi:hypothetical protein
MEMGRTIEGTRQTPALSGDLGSLVVDQVRVRFGFFPCATFEIEVDLIANSMTAEQGAESLTKTMWPLPGRLSA